MTDAMTDKLQRTTTFNLAEYAGKHNDYDRNRLRPSGHKLVVRSADGEVRSINLKQLEALLSYAAHHPHMGSVLDAVAAPVTEKLRVVD